MRPVEQGVCSRHPRRSRMLCGTHDIGQRLERLVRVGLSCLLHRSCRLVGGALRPSPPSLFSQYYNRPIRWPLPSPDLAASWLLNGSPLALRLCARELVLCVRCGWRSRALAPAKAGASDSVMLFWHCFALCLGLETEAAAGQTSDRLRGEALSQPSAAKQPCEHDSRNSRHRNIFMLPAPDRQYAASSPTAAPHGASALPCHPWRPRRSPRPDC